MTSDSSDNLTPRLVLVSTSDLIPSPDCCEVATTDWYPYAYPALDPGEKIATSTVRLVASSGYPALAWRIASRRGDINS
eukprot:scaffold232221_cov22-Prasinocladus_malaysianus.AAC.1